MVGDSPPDSTENPIVIGLLVNDHKLTQTRRNSEREIDDDILEGTNSSNEVDCSKDALTDGDDKTIDDLEEKLASLKLRMSEQLFEVETLKNQEKSLAEKAHLRALELQNQEIELDLLKAAAQMVFDDEHTLEFHIEKLNHKVEAMTHNVKELESHRNDPNARPEKNMAVKQPMNDAGNEVEKTIQKLQLVDVEMEAILSEIAKREIEHSELLLELEKLPKIPSRKSYIERVTEITKNIWKQDADIQRILQDTRLLQIENNNLQECLHRAYAVAEETVLRDGKNEPVRRQVHKILSTIHHLFAKIAEQTLASDRARRETVDQQAKLALVLSRGVDIKKVQADLDSIKLENEYLEQQTRH